MKTLAWIFHSDFIQFITQKKGKSFRFLKFWDYIWYRPIPIVFLFMLRITIFIIPLHLFASRYFLYLADVPPEHVWNFFKNARFETFMWIVPSETTLLIIHLSLLLSCLFGVIGIYVRQSSLIAAVSASFLNNLQAVATTADAEIIPYVIGLFIFAVINPDLHVTLLDLKKKGTKIFKNKSCPAYPFILLQILYAIIYYLNGKIKIDVFWEYWDLQGVYAQGYFWNIMSPYFDGFWESMKTWPRWIFHWGGLTTIIIETGAPLPILFPRLMWLFWPVIFVMHLLIYMMCTTSFLMFPYLYLVCFLPFMGLMKLKGS